MSKPVYKQYDQEQLDAQYNLRARHGDFQHYFDWWERESEGARMELNCRLDVAYGDTPLQRLDVFPAPAPGAPVHVFIHGGYWQGLDKSFFSYPARSIVGAGAALVSINYDLAPQASLDEIVRQCRRALAWVHGNAPSFNGDPERIHVSGHSAGGHLAVVLLITDWQANEGLPAGLVKGACAISGLFDLEPIRLCYLNEVIGLDAGAARHNSPLYHLPHSSAPLIAPLIAAVGGEETDEFRRQNGMLATAWRARGFPCEEMKLAGLHHFSIVQELLHADSPFTRAILAQMSL